MGGYGSYYGGLGNPVKEKPNLSGIVAALDKLEEVNIDLQKKVGIPEELAERIYNEPGTLLMEKTGVYENPLINPVEAKIVETALNFLSPTGIEDILGIGLLTKGKKIISKGKDLYNIFKNKRALDAVREGIEWQRKWNLHPTSQRLRLSQEGDLSKGSYYDWESSGEANLITKGRRLKKSIEDATSLEKKVPLTTREMEGAVGEVKGFMGERSIAVDPRRSRKKIVSTGVHEADHFSGGGISIYDRELIDESLNYAGKHMRGISKEPHHKWARGKDFDPGYFVRDYEIHARIQQLRHKMGWESWNDIHAIASEGKSFKIPKHLKETEQYKDLNMGIEEKGIRDLMLKMSGFAPVTMATEDIIIDHLKEQ